MVLHEFSMNFVYNQWVMVIRDYRHKNKKKLVSILYLLLPTSNFSLKAYNSVT